MPEQPAPWSWRPPESWKGEIEASMAKRSLKRHAWLTWAIGKVLESERRSQTRTVTPRFKKGKS